MHSDEHIRRALEYLIPGYNAQQLRQAIGPQNFDQLCSNFKEFNPEEFMEEITNRHKDVTSFDCVDKSKLNMTEKAFHFAYNPNVKVSSDYEAMVSPHEVRRDIDDTYIEPQPSKFGNRCNNPQCPGTDLKWIKCNSKKNCWYHYSCAGIPQNKTDEEINQLDWYCSKCRKTKGIKRKI